MKDVYKIREDFPILNKKINGTDLVYFDNAATSQTPKQVIQKIVDYYEKYNPIPTRKDAEHIEKYISKELRDKGVGVWFN